MFLIVHHTALATDGQFRNFRFTGRCFDAAGLITWANDQWGPDGMIRPGRVIKTIESAIAACRRDEWLVLQGDRP